MQRVTALTLMDAQYVNYISELGDFSGKQIPGIPRLIFNGAVRWESDFGANLQLGFNHAGYYFADDANTVWVPPYFILNASAGYKVKFDRLGLEAFMGVNNLADKKYAGSAFINPVNAGGSPAFLEPGLPRNYFGGFQVHFLP